eukprot:3162751-Amphidinium_carterae.2
MHFVLIVRMTDVWKQLREAAFSTQACGFQTTASELVPRDVMTELSDAQIDQLVAMSAMYADTTPGRALRIAFYIESTD